MILNLLFLSEYASFFGQYINHAKSTFYYANQSNLFIQKNENYSQCSHVSLPFNYLGSYFAGAPKSSLLQPLADKVKIKLWVRYNLLTHLLLSISLIVFKFPSDHLLWLNKWSNGSQIYMDWRYYEEWLLYCQLEYFTCFWLSRWSWGYQHLGGE